MVDSISSSAFNFTQTATPGPDVPRRGSSESPDRLREVFHEFVGQTFYGQMFQAMRKTVETSEYFDGGRGEEVFRNQLDQLLTERMTAATSDSLSEPMYQLFQLKRL